jgi:hypothetical protein
MFITIITTEAVSVQAQYYYQPPRSYYRNDTFTGGLLGAAGGAGIGAAVSPKGNRAENALIGAGVGLLGGAMLGRAADNADERQVMHGSAVAAQANSNIAYTNQIVTAQAVTTQDVIEMTRAGLSEDIIINTMRTRGSRIDTSPSSLVYMKQSGVSDRVVMAAQATPVSTPVVVPPTAINQPAPVYVTPQPVYVTPAPQVIKVYSSPYPYHYHQHRPW